MSETASTLLTRWLFWLHEESGCRIVRKPIFHHPRPRHVAKHDGGWKFSCMRWDAYTWWRDYHLR